MALLSSISIDDIKVLLLHPIRSDNENNKVQEASSIPLLHSVASDANIPNLTEKKVPTRRAPPPPPPTKPPPIKSLLPTKPLLPAKPLLSTKPLLPTKPLPSNNKIKGTIAKFNQLQEQPSSTDFGKIDKN